MPYEEVRQIRCAGPCDELVEYSAIVLDVGDHVSQGRNLPKGWLWVPVDFSDLQERRPPVEILADLPFGISDGIHSMAKCPKCAALVGGMG